MADFSGFKPRADLKGYTQVPNEFFDEVLPEIKSLSELKVLLAVFRKTYGWISHVDNESGQIVYKEEDAISMSQFKNLTGLSQPSCIDGVKRAMDDGYLERVKEGVFRGGDNTSNESAVYRIKQVGDEPEPPTEEPPIKKEIKELIGSLPAKSVQKDMSFNDGADKEESSEDILNDLFPSESEPAPKKKNEKKTYLNKKPQDWNANDLMAYFNTKYREVLGFSAGPIVMKDKALAKKLLEGYETESITKAVDYYLDNYKEISYLPSGHPAFNIFFGYRKSLIPEALDPLSAKKSGGANKSMREFDETEDKPKDNNEGGKYQW